MRSCLPRRAFSFAAVLALLVATLGLAWAALRAPQVRFDFEGGSMQGWRIVEGSFGRVTCDREYYCNEPTVPFDKQGNWFLSTLHRADNSPDDSYMGVMESPLFRLAPGKLTCRVGGGSGPSVYLALCTEDGTEIRHARGADSEHLQPVEWDTTALAGKLYFLRLADHATGGWCHITLDDVTIPGAIDEAATARHWANLQADADRRKARETAERERRMALLRRDPLLTAHPILYVVRAQYLPDHHSTETMFQTGEINTASFRGGGALKLLDIRSGATRTLWALPEGIIRDPDVSYDGRRALVSARVNAADDYHIYEVGPIPPSGKVPVRQLTSGSGISDIDPAYLPDGRIVFTSTRDPKVCQCNRHIQGNLFVMERDGGLVRQIGRNTLFEGQPSVMPDGRVMYYRWEYVDRHFGPSFGLWTCNPDGTNHAILYHNNAWSPGAMLDARVIPGTRLLLSTLGSCHDRPWGAIAVIDPAIGMEGTAPVRASWPVDIARYLPNKQDYGHGTGGHPSAWQIDTFVSMRPKYEDPYPLSSTRSLCARTIEGERTGLFLLGPGGSEQLVHEEGPGCFDPMPLAPRPVPPVIPSRVAATQPEGRVYVSDVYRGESMAGVARGAIKSLRIVEAPRKLFWSDGNWNIDATQAPAMNWNSTNNKRILGTVPVEADGSAYFTVPADRFIYFQLLDAQGKMVQSMRSGTMVRPGETAGCVGCHENRRSSPPAGLATLAARRTPRRMAQWYGAPRDFSYRAEVQPVFDRYCVSCHDYGKPAGKALNLSGDLGLAFNTSYVELRGKSPVRWFSQPMTDPMSLVKVVDDGPAEVLPAYAWGSHRSKLAQVVESDHHGVTLDPESRDRIITWIDLNAPYYGSYSTAYGRNAFGRSPLDGGQVARLRELTGVPVGDQGAEMAGSLVNLTRPDLSPCLAALPEGDARRQEALGIIRQGVAALASAPREDMPGWRLVGQDCVRQARADAHDRDETNVNTKLAQRRR